ncbi:hypothetical protein CU102_03780 [Phyllobacterium brassicacearum]|uniref:Uncharacterized protein n=1 Tax=Phyllobacterium brassicacearum TaxID=314235 RepID=A0A2P7BUT7_9HYPH|nr:hypothetical protein CU102_03780 [Phyllobacterium brassicacearum]TDQ33893.1 hypothetical protein DEV91_10496 [Phyllobacterium brassicacearum]
MLGARMHQNETKRHCELNNFEQNMRDPQNHALKTVSRKELAPGWAYTACLVAALIILVGGLFILIGL